MAQIQIQKNQYTNLSSNPIGGFNVIGYTGTIPTVTDTLVIEINANVNIWAGSGNLLKISFFADASSAASGSVTYTGIDASKTFEMKTDEIWTFADNVEPAPGGSLGPVDWTPIGPAIPITGLFLEGKKVSSMNIEGKNILSIELEGKIYRFLPPRLGDEIDISEYQLINVTNEHTISIRNYTGTLTGTGKTTPVTVNIKEDITIDTTRTPAIYINLYTFGQALIASYKYITSIPSGKWDLKAGEWWIFEDGKAPVRGAD